MGLSFNNLLRDAGTCKFIAAGLLALLLACPGWAHTDPELSGYVAVDGGRIWYRLNGSRHLGSKPAIIVIHGGPGGSHRGLLPYLALADTYPVVLYDQLDAGNSQRTNQPANWTVQRFKSEIQQLRQHLGLQDVVVAGHSWGGSLAAEYAVDNPAGLRALILSSPLLNTRQWLQDNELWIDQLPAQTARAIRHHQAAGTTDHPDYRAAEKVFLQQHMCRRQPCPRPDYLQGGAALNTTVYEYMWGPSEFHATGTLRDYDVSQRLPGVSVPTLMICGEYDEAAPQSCRRYAGMIPGARTAIIPDAGHSTLRENEGSYIRRVRFFLAHYLRD